MLHGSPGVGKSQALKQIADELGWKFIDIRLSMLMPSDLLGLPYPDEKHEKTNWLWPSMFPPPNSKDNYILLFDEIGLANVSVQGASYRICLDRSLGEHYKLPSGVRIVAATNLITDSSHVQQMSKALANRFIHFYIEPNLKSWKEWAYKNNIDGRIIGFLNFKEDMLYRKPNIEDHAYPTPRSWFFLSRLLEFGIIDEEAIDGTVGKGAASEFLSYLEVYQKLPDVNKILSGKNVAVPKEPSILYALCSSLVTKADKQNITNIFKYCEKMPVDFHVLTIRDISRKDDEKGSLLNCYSGFNKWLEKHDALFNDII